MSFIFGPDGSPPALGALPVTQPAKVIQFVDGYSASILKNEWNGGYVFKVTNSNYEFSERVVAWIKRSLPQVKKVGMVIPNDAVGQLVVPVLVEAYKASGYEVIVEHFERGTKEFTPFLLRLQGADIDLLDLNSNTPGDVGLIVKQARQGGYRKPIIQTGGAGIDEIVAVAGPLAEGFMRYEMIDDTAPRVKAFIDEYKRRYKDFNGPAPAWYNAAYMLFEAMRRAKTLDPTAVRDEIRKLGDFDAPMFGPVIWTGNERYGVAHQILHPFVIKEVVNGQGVVKETVSVN